MLHKRLAAFAMTVTIGLSLFSGSLGAASNDFKDQPTAGEMFGDAVVVRPLTLLASAVGAAAWVVSLPFSIAGGNAGETGRALVLDPLEYTFVRPIGDMSDNR